MAKTKKDDGTRKEFISNIVEIVGSTQLSNAALELDEVDINNERERLWRNEELRFPDNVYAIVKYNNQLFKNMNANVFVPVQKKYLKNDF